MIRNVNIPVIPGVTWPLWSSSDTSARYLKPEQTGFRSTIERGASGLAGVPPSVADCPGARSHYWSAQLVCLSFHPPAGWGPRGRGCMWDHVGTNLLPATRFEGFFIFQTSCLSLLPSTSLHANLTWRRGRWRLGRKETRSAERPVTVVLECWGNATSRLELVLRCNSFRSTRMSWSR